MEPVTFSPRAKSKKRLVCAVEGCNSRYNKDLEIRFHYFPIAMKRFVYVKNIFGNLEKMDQLRAWMKALKLKEVNPNMKVCSLHFHKDDYILPNVASKRKCLKSNAVPSRNLPHSPNTAACDAARRERLVEKNREKVEEKHIEVDQSVSKSHENDVSDNVIKMNVVIEMTANTERHTSDSSGSVSMQDLGAQFSGSVQDFGTQVETNLFKPSFIHLINTNAELSTFTGIESFSLLHTIVEIVTKKFGNQLKHCNTKMSIRDRIVMTYVKLKQNLAYDCLAIMFQCCSADTCQRVFIEMIKVLSEFLKCVIKWPSRETILENMPACFEGFEDVVVILDCTEIFIQQTENLCCQLMTYSTYKELQTCKFMTGVTPAGNISYISKAYGGRTSDQAIFNNSDIKKYLQPGDAIMVDKGFTIDNECLANNWKCYRPPFLKDKRQFSKSEAILTSKIAKARVHVERSNQKIKNFKIMGETMPSNLIPVVEDIFLVICATINLSSPILKDDIHECGRLMKIKVENITNDLVLGI